MTEGHFVFCKLACASASVEVQYTKEDRSSGMSPSRVGGVRVNQFVSGKQAENSIVDNRHARFTVRCSYSCGYLQR